MSYQQRDRRQGSLPFDCHYIDHQLTRALTLPHEVPPSSEVGAERYCAAPRVRGEKHRSGRECDSQALVSKLQLVGSEARAAACMVCSGTLLIFTSLIDSHTMPRPKVKPENRKRSICACIPCKTSKIRCDAADPCGPCSKRERAGSCVYPANNRSTGARKRRRLSTASGPVETDDSLPNAPLLGQDSDADGQRARRDEAVEGGMSNSSEASESDEPVSCQTEGRMLFNSKGEKCTCRWFLY
jgi:hypothetical protein